MATPTVASTCTDDTHYAVSALCVSERSFPADELFIQHELQPVGGIPCLGYYSGQCSCVEKHGLGRGEVLYCVSGFWEEGSSTAKC